MCSCHDHSVFSSSGSVQLIRSSGEDQHQRGRPWQPAGDRPSWSAGKNQIKLYLYWPFLQAEGFNNASSTLDSKAQFPRHGLGWITSNCVVMVQSTATKPMKYRILIANSNTPHFNYLSICVSSQGKFEALPTSLYLVNTSLCFHKAVPKQTLKTCFFYSSLRKKHLINSTNIANSIASMSVYCRFIVYMLHQTSQISQFYLVKN